MSDAARNTNPSNNIPQITSLSIAFPMNFESANPETTPDLRQAATNPVDAPRPPHRHDAGK